VRRRAYRQDALIDIDSACFGQYGLCGVNARIVAYVDARHGIAAAHRLIG
jgi:hypothetical protein